MNEDSQRSLINKNRNCSAEISTKETIKPAGSIRPIPQDEQLPQHTTYGSLWFYNFFRKSAIRILNDMLMSFLRYWFPNTVPVPHHLVDLLRVHNTLRAQRELHTVTYSSEDDASYQPNTNSYEFHTTDYEPIFVIVDSSNVSDPSSKEILVEKKHSKEVPKKYFWNNAAPIDVPSTSTEFYNNVLPHVTQTESVDELQMMTINFQSENEAAITESELDKESVVISYLYHKDEVLEMEGTLLSSKKKASLLESVAKMETILENVPKISDTLLDALIPSYPGSPRSTIGILSATDLTSLDCEGDLKEALDFLHHDDALLTAAETGDVKMLEHLIKLHVNIHEKDHLGRNALHFAVNSGNRDAVLVLLNAGVDPNVKDNLGMTPLSLSIMRKPSWRMANMLFDYGARILPRSDKMDTGLFIQFVMMCTPTKEEERIIQLLIENGFLIDDPEAPGRRQALHFAAMSNNCALIKILTNLGADLLSKNHRNETPKDVAATFKCREAYNLLQELEDGYNMSLGH